MVDYTAGTSFEVLSLVGLQGWKVQLLLLIGWKFLCRWRGRGIRRPGSVCLPTVWLSLCKRQGFLLNIWIWVVGKLRKQRLRGCYMDVNWACRRNQVISPHPLEETCLGSSAMFHPLCLSGLYAATQNWNSPRTKTGMKPPQGIGIVVAMTAIKNWNRGRGCSCYWAAIALSAAPLYCPVCESMRDLVVQPESEG